MGQRDIYIAELSKGIEFDGEYWHRPEVLRIHRKNWTDHEINNYHKIKDEFMATKGIEILHIAENTWNSSKNECLQAILTFIEVSQNV